MDVDTFLEHHGIKGQKWGIRRDPRTGIRPIANTLDRSKFGDLVRRNVERHNASKTKLITHPNGRVVIARPSRKDKKWQKNIYSLPGAIAVHNHVADQMNNGILDKLNSKPQYKNHRMFDKFDEPNQDKISQSYFKEYDKLNFEATQRAVSSVHGKSPSGNFKAVLGKNSNKQWQVKIHKVDVTHADIPWEDLVMDVELDALGHVVQVANIKDSMSQSSITEEFLEHHGIKGQKWGIRHKPRSGSISDDHRTVSELRRMRTSQLTNQQLKTANERLNLEQNFNRLNPTKIQRGRRAVRGILGTIGISSVISFLNSNLGKATIERGKKFLTKG